MSALAARRCFNHAQREAVARCTLCSNFFCRECITEHDGRMICARCLLPDATPHRHSLFFARILRTCQVLAGIMILWLVIFLIGQALLRLPSSFHEGTLWGTTEGER